MAGTPWSDMTKTGDTFYTNELVDNVIGSYDGLLDAAAKLYAGDHDLKEPPLSPVYGDLSDFPPPFFSPVRDLFLSNTVRVHQKLLQAGGVAELLRGDVSLWVASEPASLKWVFLADFNLSHNYGQLLFVHIHSGYPIPHRLPPGGGGERAGDYIKQGLGLSPLPQGERQRTIYSLDHARSGSDTCTASGSPLCARSRRSEPARIMAWL